MVSRWFARPSEALSPSMQISARLRGCGPTSADSPPRAPRELRRGARLSLANVDEKRVLERAEGRSVVSRWLGIAPPCRSSMSSREQNIDRMQDELADDLAAAFRGRRAERLTR